MNRRVNRQEIQSVIDNEREDSENEKFLDKDEIENYLYIIKEEIEQNWTYEDYLTYWINREKE